MSATKETKHPFDLEVYQLRAAVKDLGEKLKHFMISDKPGDWTRDCHDPAEMHANLLIAYRHLEDARMRLGKAVQARDGGVSVYER